MKKNAKQCVRKEKIIINLHFVIFREVELGKDIAQNLWIGFLFIVFWVLSVSRYLWIYFKTP